jgi:acetylornithine deacetylase/succinyl-diaminopimelate desuccinylase-like protein
MSDLLNTAVQYAHENQSKFLTEFKDLLRIPSVSTDPDHKPDMHKAASFLAEKLKKLSFDAVQILPTAGHPVVYGEHLRAGSQAQTVLIYGHYDVQPAEPLELWDSGAFDPEIRDGQIYARGASDMKGQVMAVIYAIESILAAESLHINVKVLFEGEEEIGSPHLDSFIEQHQRLLACDFALNPDGGMIAADVPTIIYGLRGLAYFELRIYGPAHDLHSGLFGGAIHNPAQVLCELIAGMHDGQGRITLPGYYDRVRPLSTDEKLEISRLGMDEAYYKKQTGAVNLWGEAGYLPAERIGARPTLEINGILSGFTGAGSKTVLPAKAMAKISMRLVPDQNPSEVHQQLIRYLETHAPDTVRWELDEMAGGPACITDRNLPAAQALARALEAVWGKKPVYKREGGSIPVVASMQTLLGVDSVVTGFGLGDDNIHAPNEHLSLRNWTMGIDALIHFFYYMGER